MLKYVRYSTIKATCILGILLTFHGIIAQDAFFIPIDTLQVYYQESLTYTHQNRIAPAMESLEKAAKLAEKNEDIKALLDTYHKFALLYLEIDDRETTLFYWERAGILLKDYKYPYGKAIHQFINASLLFKSKDYRSALNELEEAKKINNDKNLVNNILLLEADILLEVKQYKEASVNYNALLINSDENERAYLATMANLGLATLHRQQNNYENSIKHGEAALQLAKENDFFRAVVTSSNFLADLYEGTNNYKKALVLNKELSKINDSLFNLEKVRLETRTANDIKFDQQRKIINQLEAENEELSISANRFSITATLTSLFLIVISILSISLFRNNRLKRKTNKLLQARNTELEQARDDAVSAMQAKSEFLSTVTHELRTPLYAITGLTYLLLEENPLDHQKEHLKALKFSGDYLMNFVNDILQVNKIGADKLETLSIQFKLKEVLTDVIDSLRTNAKENNNKLILRYDNNIPFSLLGDPLKISQIFMNLVGNALKFTNNGEVVVTAKLKNRKSDICTVSFEVTDNGIGISEKQQQNIFEGFEQGSIQINREYGGTGLGLAIVKSLLGLFSSTINLESTLGRGSRFYFDLNLKEKEMVLDEEDFDSATQDFDFKGLHLLVVEDNKINQIILHAITTR